MGTVNISDYREIYFETAREYTNSLSKSCNKLAENPFDKDALNQLHISSHSLGSQGQVMRFTNMASLCAIIEKISRAVLEGRYRVNPDFIFLLKEAVRELNLCLAQIEKEGKEKDLSILTKKFENIPGIV